MLYIYTCYNDKLAPAETLSQSRTGIPSSGSIFSTRHRKKIA
jgi:hypothetical protein